MKKQACVSNPYQVDNTAITYGLTQIGDGYALRVTLPKGHVSSGDKLKIIDWLRDYRSQVVHANPLWCANFRTTESGYLLEIKPLKGPRQIASEGDRVREMWQKTLTYA